ncbi:HNH endonuclease [Paenibacillus ihumii]|uniref:HNH endonuclease n=1 Tax=Paenibacillus ihumii TaxID=687436 RepID=UPI0006D7EAF0|nr:HNH endonuclease signature motif containing protein [Paenibacillus ihumii]
MKQVNPFYKSKEWRKCRLVILKRDHYLCQPCLRKGKVTTANTVHHIKPLETHPELALDGDNLESICPTCHNKKHPEKGSRQPMEAKRKRRATILEAKPNPERW